MVKLLIPAPSPIIVAAVPASVIVSLFVLPTYVPNVPPLKLRVFVAVFPLIVVAVPDVRVKLVVVPLPKFVVVIVPPFNV